MNFKFGKLINKRIPFVLTPVRVLAISTLIAGQFLFILFFLGASETDNYEASYKYFRLSGYALCIVGPYFMFYVIEKQVYSSLRSWKLSYELISKSLLAFTILSLSYFYNISIVNNISGTFYNYYYFIVWYGLPYLPLILPGALFLHWQFAQKEPDETVTEKPKSRLTIKGKNKNEALHIEKHNFVLAEANQNYVTIKFMAENRLHKKIIRSTLSEVNKQIPHAQKIHRSYLINPKYIAFIRGNSRKKWASLTVNDDNIPVSPGIEKELFI